MYQTCVTRLNRTSYSADAPNHGVWGVGKGTVLSNVSHRVAFAVANILNNDQIEVA